MTAIALPESPATAPAPAAPAAPPAAFLAPDGGPRFIVNRGPLLDALNALAPLTKERTAKAVLNTYRLTATADTLAVEATTLEQSARCEVSQYQAERTGAACIPAEKLRECLMRATADSVEIDCGSGQAVVKCGGGKWTLFCLDPEAWPFPTATAFPCPIGSIPATEMRRLIRQCLPAVSTAANRYVFTGLLLAQEGKRLAAVTTDGRRLAYATTPWAGGKFVNAILPVAALKALLPNLPDEGDVGIWLGRDASEPPVAAFHCPDGYALRTGLLEGQFPPYPDIIPTESDRRLEAGKEALLSIIGQAGVFVPTDGREDKDGKFLSTHALRLSLSGRGLTVSARDPLAGDAEAVLACKFTGADLEWGANPRFLADAVAACEGPDVAVEFTAPNRPCLVTDGGSAFRSVVMPVNLT